MNCNIVIVRLILNCHLIGTIAATIPSKSNNGSLLKVEGENIGQTVILDLQNDIEKLNEEIRHLKQVNADALRYGEDLNTKLNDAGLKYNHDMAVKETELKEVAQKEQKALHKQNKLKLEFGKQLANVDAEITSLTKSLDDRRKELELCKRENAELTVKNNKLENKTAETLLAKSELLENVSYLQERILQKEREIKENEGLLDQKSKEANDAAKRDELCKTQITRLKEEIDNLNAELTELKETLSKADVIDKELQQSIREKDADIERYKTMNDTKSAEIQNLAQKYKSDLSKYSSDLDASKKQFDDLKNYTKTIDQDLANARIATDQLSTNNEVLRNDIEKLEREKQSLANEKHEEKAKSEITFQSQKDDLEIKINMLENDLSKACKDGEFYKLELNEIKSKSSTLQKQYDEILSDKAVLQQEIEAVGTRLQEQEAEIHEHKTTICMKSNELEDAKMKLESSASTNLKDLSKLEETNKELCETISRQKTDLEQLISIKEKLSADYSNVENHKNLLVTENKKLLNEKEILIEEKKKFVDKRDESEAKIHELNAQLEVSHKDQDNCKKEIEKMKTIYEKQEKQYKELQVTNAESGRIIENFQTQAKVHAQESDENRIVIEAGQQEIENITSRFNELSEKSSSEAARYNTEINKLSEQIVSLEGKLKDISMMKEQLLLENQEIKGAVKRYESEKQVMLTEKNIMQKREENAISAQKEHYEDQVKELKHCLELNEKNVEIHGNELCLLRKNLEAAVSTREQYAAENLEMKSIINKNEKEIQSLLETKQAYKVESDEKLACQTQKFELELEIVTKQLDDKTKELASCKEELLHTNLKVVHIEKKATENERANSELHTKYDEMEKILNEKERKIQDSEEELSTKTKAMEDLGQKYKADMEASSFELADCKKQINVLSDQASLYKTESSDNLLLKEQLLSENKDLKVSLEALSEEKVTLTSQVEEKLAAQKEKFEGKLKKIADLANKQYKENLEKGLSQLNRSIESRDKTIKENEKDMKTQKDQIESLKLTANKYEVAKIKLKDMLDVVEQERTDKNALEDKYQASKEAIKTLQQEREKMKSQLKDATSRGPYVELQNDNDSLRYKIKQLTSENRSLTVQVTHANTQIRELQSEKHQSMGGSTGRKQDINCTGDSSSTRFLDRRQTMAGVQSTSRASFKDTTKDVDEIFKMPAGKRGMIPTHNTPGRAKAGRTQSEATLARRPPMGSGSMFLTDDEAGEMFSSSYLSDMKDGKCNPFGNISANGSGFDRRLSELSRRNTMVPAHLKSSYPAETQFFHIKEFNDADLQHGRLTNIMPSDKGADVTDITRKAAQLSVDSPAMNTRNKRKPIAFDIQVGNDINDNGSGTPALTLEEALNDKVVNAALIGKKGTKKGTKRLSSGSVLSAHLSAMNDSRDSCSVMNKSSSSNASSKRTRKDHSVSYSRPGPPTPARVKGNKSICSNTSLESAGELNLSSVSTQNKSTASSRPTTVVSSEYKNHET